MAQNTESPTKEQPVRIPVGHTTLEGNLAVPVGARGIVVFAHGSGSGRHSPRNRYVADVLQSGGLGTLLIDLLTAEEEAVDLRTAHLRFDIGLLAERLVGATDWLREQDETRGLPIGSFGASTGAGAALVAAAERPETVRAVVSRGGRPDLAGEALTQVRCPVLLIVGGADLQVLQLNHQAMRVLRTVKRLDIVPEATHLFEEPGALGTVAQLARDWFTRYLSAAPAATPEATHAPSDELAPPPQA